LSFKITDHFLVPKHMIEPKEKVDELLNKLGIRKEDMPQISKADPAIKELKPDKGDIIKIIRDSPTAGKTIYYRRVV